MKLLSVIIILLFVSVIYSKPIGQPFKVRVQIYDQFPKFNNNFQPKEGGVKVTGLIKSTLNTTTRVPELVSLSTNGTNAAAFIRSPSLFKYFFSSQPDPTLPGHNIPLDFDLDFNHTETGDSIFFDSQKFFPIDYQGFDVDPAKRIYGESSYHNFHFCMKLNTEFTYHGFEVINFKGDDDLWVFINNQLVIDLGGLHSPLEATVNTKTLGLTIGKSYNFDIFYCERRTEGSSLKIETNVMYSTYSTYKNFCGTKNGDGSECCDPFLTCNDNNECTIDSCPPPGTPLGPGPISNYCIHTKVC
ncbi:hypothetical protein ACTA71_005519 [Dictyostelium dimigraforme]